MAKGGNGKGKGLDQAADNFANGYYNNSNNGNADSGLDNAKDKNALEFGITIDFDSGTNTVTYDYGWYSAGTYEQDGFTLNWSNDDWYWSNYGDTAIQDVDGDGDNEFGGSNGYYSYTYGHLTQDSGESFSLGSVEVVGDSNDYYNWSSVYIGSYNEDENAWTWSYNVDDGQDVWTSYTYDYDTHTYTTYAEQSDSESVGEHHQDVEYVTLTVYNDNWWSGSTTDTMALDNIEVA